MWLADFDFQTSGWIFSVSLYPNESTESVTSRFSSKMGNSSTPNLTQLDQIFFSLIWLFVIVIAQWEQCWGKFFSADYAIVVYLLWLLWSRAEHTLLFLWIPVLYLTMNHIFTQLDNTVESSIYTSLLLCFISCLAFTSIYIKQSYVNPCPWGGGVQGSSL